MKLLVTTFFIISILIGSTDKKIKITENILNGISKNSESINVRLNSVASKINSVKKEIIDLDIRAKKLSRESLNSKDINSIKLKELKELNRELRRLKKEYKNASLDLVKFISYNLNLHSYKNSNIYDNEESFIKDTMIKNYKVIVDKKVVEFSNELKKLKRDIYFKKSRIKKLNKKINLLDYKRDLISENRLKKKKLTLKLKRDLLSYKTRLNKINKESLELSKALLSLKIIKKREDNKRVLLAKERQRKAKLKKLRKMSRSELSKNSGLAVVDKVVRYRGSRTISPFVKYRVIIPFGKYRDKEYGITVNSDAVVIKPIDSKSVKAIFDGKVVIAKRYNKFIGSIIVIKHKNNMSTTYAKILSIANGIKKGSFVKKGTVIGKVSSSGLQLKIFQKNSIINPIDVISKSR